MLDYRLDVEVLKIFLDAGADPNLQMGPQGITSLFFALRQKNVPPVKSLLERMAINKNIDTRDEYVDFTE